MRVKTSGRGKAYIGLSENDVLKAYLCPAGTWTIGRGLTAASGVVKPHAGMVITQAESDRLFSLALEENYEPRVAEAMPAAQQHEFDGGVSFDWNTGAIHRASWVKLWRARAAPARIRKRLGLWKKGGGRVLPGLVRRRREEADIILLNKWPAAIDIPATPARPTVAFAAIVISMTTEEIEEVRKAFRKLGYEPGPMDGRVRLDAVTKFQSKHDLTVDGLIGRATLSTLQRELDARKKAQQGTTATAGGGAGATANEAAAPAGAPAPIDAPADIIGDPLVTWGAAAIGILGALFLLYLAWHYRDVVAARVQGFAPKTAAWLRSF